MTIPQIQVALREAGKPVSRETLYVYFRRFKIKPISRYRQCPQRYPMNSATRIMAKLGFKRINGKAGR